MTLYSPKGYAFNEYFSSPTMTGQGMPTEISFTIPQNADPLIGKKSLYVNPCKYSTNR